MYKFNIYIWYFACVAWYIISRNVGYLANLGFMSCVIICVTEKWLYSNLRILLLTWTYFNDGKDIKLHTLYSVDRFIYWYPTFNICTVEVWEWISNFIPHRMMNVITYSHWDLSRSKLKMLLLITLRSKLNHLNKMSSWFVHFCILNNGDILSTFHTFPFKNMHFKISSMKWCPFCLSFNLLRIIYVTVSSLVLCPPCGICWCGWIIFLLYGGLL